MIVANVDDDQQRPSARSAAILAPVRVLMTKIGFDGHDRGSRIVAVFLRDAGMEVIYTPPWQSEEAVVNIALQEDVDVIGISSLATDHLIVPKLMLSLSASGLGHVAVIVGGIVPAKERTVLLNAGVSAIFGPGSPRQEIVDTARTLGEAAYARKMQDYSR